MNTNHPGRSVIPRPARAAGLGLLLATTLGCGGTGSVSGTVSHKPTGKKLVWGTVTMIGSDGIGRGGQISPDGTYAVQGVPAGKVKILISSPDPKPKADPTDRQSVGKRRSGPPGAVESPPEAPPEVVKGWFRLPEKYSDAAQSPLTADVKRGPNTHDIVLD